MSQLAAQKHHLVQLAGWLSLRWSFDESLSVPSTSQVSTRL